MNLNDRISKIIEYSAYSPSEFAEAVDVQRSSISHITSGRNKPSLDFLVKVKDRFPELQWDWIIKGDGEMLKDDDVPKSQEELEKPRTTSLPDLFTLIEGDYLGSTESEDRILHNAVEASENPTARELGISAQGSSANNLDDSQRLEASPLTKTVQNTNNQEDRVKRIVLFYESGKFESFEP